MTGINIQSPWANLLVNETKTVETRSYSLPKKYECVELALIETPGKNGNFKSRVIGTITFSHSFRYNDELEWSMDHNRHKVNADSLYGWNDKPKYGWVVSTVKKFEQPIEITKRKGIIFTTGILA